MIDNLGEREQSEGGFAVRVAAQYTAYGPPPGNLGKGLPARRKNYLGSRPPIL